MKRIVGSFMLLLLVGHLQAQNIAVSPYSSYGLGEDRFNQGAATFGMAGISTAYLSPYGTETNFLNPAANQNLRLTNFVFEGSTNLVNFDNGKETFNRSASYLSKVALGLPIGQKATAGVGFQPYSAVGYKTAQYDYSSTPETLNKFEGDGGLNTFQIMGSYNFSPEFSIGLRANYLFGTLNKKQIFVANDVQLLSEYNNQNEINGFTFTGGLMYSKKFEGDKRLNIGATYGLGTDLNSDQRYLVTTYQVNGTNFKKFNIDTIQYSSGDKNVKLPQNLSVGVSYGENLKWNVGAQVDWENNADFNLPNDNAVMNNKFRTAVGGYYIPQFNSFRSYFARATYRAGAYYEKTPLVVANQDITDYGITFGIGLPIGKVTDPSELNLGVQLGQRGTTESNLVKESYANIKLSFTLNDAWFQRRKYD